jgi:VanZ family protein
MKKILSLILLIIWIIIIFLLSNQSGSVSTNESDIIVNSINNILNINEHLLVIIVRKLAHIIEYFILYLLTYNCFKEYGIKYKYASIIFCIFCGLIDEVHQLFINGRSGQIIDVFVDLIGIIIGYIIIEVIYGKKKEIKENSSSQA